MSSISRSTALLISLTSLIGNTSLKGQVSLDYSTDFETGEGYILNAPLSGDWTTDSSSITISDESVYSNFQAVKIPASDPEYMLSLGFDPLSATVVYVDYYAKMTASSPQSLPLLTIPETSVALGLTSFEASNGGWILLNGDGQGDGQWIAAGDLASLDGNSLSDWHRVTLRLNLVSNQWDAYVDGSLVAVDLGFAEAMTVSSEALLLYGNATGLTFIDKFSLRTTNPLFIDSDGDGMSDVFENANGLNPSADDRDLDADSDGLSNIEEFAFGLDPQDGTDAATDLDGDGYSNLMEASYGTNPLVMSEPISGILLFEKWNNISGGTVSKLTSHADYPDNPDSVSYISTLDMPQNVGDLFGVRIRGYLVPEVSGNYHIWLSANNRGEVYLSSDSFASNAALIAYNASQNSYGEWDQDSTQKSSLISLNAGEYYYFEVLYKEGSNNDHLSIAWTKPDSTFEIIPPTAIATLVPNDSDLDKLPDTYEQIIIDADSNDAYGSFSDVLSSDDFDGDGLTNGEEWAIGTSSITNDTDGDGISDDYEVSSNILDPLDSNDGVSDFDEDGYSAALEFVMGTDPEVWNGSIDGYVVSEEWHGVSGSTIALLLADTDYPDAPDFSYAQTSLDYPRNLHDDFGVRIRGYICPDVTGSYYFQLASKDYGEFWLSSGNDPANMTLAAYVDNSTTAYQDWTNAASQTSATLNLVAGEYYYFELLMKDDSLADHLSLRWNKPDGNFEILSAQNLATYATGDVDRDFVSDVYEQVAVDADPNDNLESVWDVLPTDDLDGDGLDNVTEMSLGLSLTDPDTDGDGLPDAFEQSIVDFAVNDGFDSHTSVLPNDDFDGDNVTNLEEYQIGSDPTDADTNDDGRNDDFEWAVISASETDSIQTISDVQALGAAHDVDGDGLTDIYEYTVGLALNLSDTDGDGLEDGWEAGEGYSAAINEGQTGAFGDIEGDLLANKTENVIGSSASTIDDTASILATTQKTGGDFAIILIGRGEFTISEASGDSLLTD